MIRRPLFQLVGRRVDGAHRDVLIEEEEHGEEDCGKIARKMYFNGSESIGINKGLPPANTKPPGIESRVKEPNDVIGWE